MSTFAQKELSTSDFDWKCMVRYSMVWYAMTWHILTSDNSKMEIKFYY